MKRSASEHIERECVKRAMSECHVDEPTSAVGNLACSNYTALSVPLFQCMKRLYVWILSCARKGDVPLYEFVNEVDVASGWLLNADDVVPFLVHYLARVCTTFDAWLESARTSTETTSQTKRLYEAMSMIMTHDATQTWTMVIDTLFGSVQGAAELCKALKSADVHGAANVGTLATFVAAQRAYVTQFVQRLAECAPGTELGELLADTFPALLAVVRACVTKAEAPLVRFSLPHTLRVPPANFVDACEAIVAASYVSREFAAKPLRVPGACTATTGVVARVYDAAAWHALLQRSWPTAFGTELEDASPASAAVTTRQHSANETRVYIVNVEVEPSCLLMHVPLTSAADDSPSAPASLRILAGEAPAKHTPWRDTHSAYAYETRLCAVQSAWRALSAVLENSRLRVDQRFEAIRLLARNTSDTSFLMSVNGHRLLWLPAPRTARLLAPELTQVTRNRMTVAYASFALAMRVARAFLPESFRSMCVPFMRYEAMLHTPHCTPPSLHSMCDGALFTAAEPMKHAVFVNCAAENTLLETRLVHTRRNIPSLPPEDEATTDASAQLMHLLARTTCVVDAAYARGHMDLVSTIPNVSAQRRRALADHMHQNTTLVHDNVVDIERLRDDDVPYALATTASERDELVYYNSLSMTSEERVARAHEDALRELRVTEATAAAAAARLAAATAATGDDNEAISSVGSTSALMHFMSSDTVYLAYAALFSVPSPTSVLTPRAFAEEMMDDALYALAFYYVTPACATYVGVLGECYVQEYERAQTATSVTVANAPFALRVLREALTQLVAGASVSTWTTQLVTDAAEVLEDVSETLGTRVARHRTGVAVFTQPFAQVADPVAVLLAFAFGTSAAALNAVTQSTSFSGTVPGHRIARLLSYAKAASDGSLTPQRVERAYFDTCYAMVGLLDNSVRAMRQFHVHPLTLYNVMFTRRSMEGRGVGVTADIVTEFFRCVFEEHDVFEAVHTPIRTYYRLRQTRDVECAACQHVQRRFRVPAGSLQRTCALAELTEKSRRFYQTLAWMLRYAVMHGIRVKYVLADELVAQLFECDTRYTDITAQATPPVFYTPMGSDAFVEAYADTMRAQLANDDDDDDTTRAMTRGGEVRAVHETTDLRWALVKRDFTSRVLMALIHAVGGRDVHVARHLLHGAPPRAGATPASEFLRVRINVNDDSAETHGVMMQHIAWLKRLFDEDMSRERVEKFMRCCTGNTAIAPVTCVLDMRRNTDGALPEFITCMRMVRVCRASSYERLRDALHMAIDEALASSFTME